MKSRRDQPWHSAESPRLVNKRWREQLSMQTSPVRYRQPASQLARYLRQRCAEVELITIIIGDEKYHVVGETQVLVI